MINYRVFLHRRKLVFIILFVLIFYRTVRQRTSSNRRVEPKSVRQLHLCRSDFQRTLILPLFNRTLILYEAEWFSRTTLNILTVMVESPAYPMQFIGNFLSEFDRFYAVECRYKDKVLQGRLKYFNMHDYDRTVLIQCQTNQLDVNESSTVELRFVELGTTKTHSIDVHLCWSNDRRVTIGHCHKAFFDQVPFHLVEQWLNYHLSLGVELFYMYDRTLTYRSRFELYIQRGQVVYVEFPLAKEYADRERFNWIDQFVGKMHCLMHLRSSVDWLGTWDIDEYLNIFDNQSSVYLPKCDETGRCSSMLSDYLTANFENHSNLIIYAANFLGRRSLTAGKRPLVIEQFQHRWKIWNDRVKYLVRPLRTEAINIHYALYIADNSTYESHLKTPDERSPDDRRALIRLHHYPSAQIQRDDVFSALLPGKPEFQFDPLLWRIVFQMHRVEK